jgi:dTDP-glucose 4,6-dehydratase
VARSLLVTGGAGFIGSNFVHYILGHHRADKVLVYDKLTYAGNPVNLSGVKDDPRFRFVQADIRDATAVEAAVAEYGIDTIVNFAAETHVDRSIEQAEDFITTDVYGTHVLLEVARRHGLRYHQVSTDEVYGHVPAGASREEDAVTPRSPYAASKTAGDLLVNAFHITYGMFTTLSRGSNNVGPYQYPEKVVPLFVTNAIDDQPLPMYGDGLQERDYMWVVDHCEAIDLILRRGGPGETYNVAAGRSITNLEMAEHILRRLGKPRSLIQHVADRPGHDRRYALDVSKLRSLGWQPRHDPPAALVKTVDWYVDNEWWWRPIKAGEYRQYYEQMYGSREVLSTLDAVEARATGGRA